MREAYILCGIPGSGKSTFVKELRHKHPYVCSFSTDDYFMVDGEYKFDPDELPTAHKWNLRNWLKAVHHLFESFIVCDNTNLSIAEIAPYYASAEAYGYDVKIKQFSVFPAIAMERNIHGVPEHTIQRMAKNFENLRFPPWWKVERS